MTESERSKEGETAIDLPRASRTRRLALSWLPPAVVVLASFLIVLGDDPVIAIMATLSAFVASNLLLALSLRTAPDPEVRSEMWRRDACFLNAQWVFVVVLYGMVSCITFGIPMDQGISILPLFLLLVGAVGLNTLANFLLSRLFRQPFDFWRGPRLD